MEKINADEIIASAREKGRRIAESKNRVTVQRGNGQRVDKTREFLTATLAVTILFVVTLSGFRWPWIHHVEAGLFFVVMAGLIYCVALDIN